MEATVLCDDIKSVLDDAPPSPVSRTSKAIQIEWRTQENIKNKVHVKHRQHFTPSTHPDFLKFQYQMARLEVGGRLNADF